MIVTTPAFRVVLFTSAHGQNDLRAFRDLTRALFFEASLTPALRPNAAHVIECESGRSWMVEEHAVWGRWDKRDQDAWYAQAESDTSAPFIQANGDDEGERL